MALFRIHVHVDIGRNFAELKANAMRIIIYKHYTAVCLYWWADSKEKMEKFILEFLEQNDIDWSGVFVKECNVYRGI